MDSKERAARLRAMLEQIAGDEGEGLESLADRGASALEGLEPLEESPEGKSLRKLARGEEVSPEEVGGLEAIVLPKKRPVAFIRGGKYDPLVHPWLALNEEPVRERLEPLLASVGRIELPNNPWVPYGGTGFLVGPGLIMTNRHVAELFTDGLGARGLVFRSGDAGIDFVREKGTPEDDRSAYLEVRKVVMIHPYWDMALLSVDGIPASRRVLTLTTRAPEDLRGADVAVVGYPARDDRSDLATQDRIFQGVYNVKRFQPGKVRQAERIRSFGHTVPAMTHDSSTLGGNSGSAVLDVRSTEIVGLHFAGVYLKANYAVPARELARDPRVVDAGAQFAGTVSSRNEEVERAWRDLEGESPPRPVSVSVPADLSSSGADAGSATFTIPIRVSISLGVASAELSGVASAQSPGTMTEGPRFQIPFIHDDLPSREGYKEDFLELEDDEVVPLPALTKRGARVVSVLEDDTPELKYHRFSVVMHKKRRLALFTAANVDWRKPKREIDGRKPTRRELTGIPDGTQERWVTDPRIPESHQLPDDFYTKDGGAFDKGHLVRRDDVAWGESFEDMRKGNGDTYHTTNCSPQVAGFNRSAQIDNWGDLENLIQRQTRAERVCLFSGPVLDEEDEHFHGRDKHGRVSIQIPRRFWKIVVCKGQDGPQAFGFLLEQDLSAVPLHEEMAVPAAWKGHMVSIAEIESLLGGWVKLSWLKRHDQLDTSEGVELRASVEGRRP